MGSHEDFEAGLKAPPLAQARDKIGIIKQFQNAPDEFASIARQKEYLRNVQAKGPQQLFRSRDRYSNDYRFENSQLRLGAEVFARQPLVYTEARAPGNQPVAATIARNGMARHLNRVCQL